MLLDKGRVAPHDKKLHFKNHVRSKRLAQPNKSKGRTFLTSKGAALHDSGDAMKIVKAYLNNGLMYCRKVNRL